MNFIDSLEAARQLGFAESTLRKFRLQGTGPRFVKVGRMVRYRPEDIAAWAAKRVVSSTSQVAA